MKINLSKLKNVVHKDDGKIVAQCPACAAEGGDAKCEHLVIFPDGKFGCVVNPKDKAHNREIMELASNGAGSSAYKLTIQRVQIADSVIIMNLGRLGRPFSSPKESEGKNHTSMDTTAISPEVENTRPKRPESDTAHADAVPPPKPVPRAQQKPVAPPPRVAPRFVDDPTLTPYDEAMAHNGCVGGNGVNGATDEEIKAFLTRN